MSYSAYCIPLIPFVRFCVNRFLFLLSLSVAGIACERQETYIPTEEDKRVLRTYASLTLLHDSFPSTDSSDSLSLYQTRVDSVLHAFGFTREEFRRESEGLLNSPERFQPLFQELTAQVQKEMRK